MIAMKNKLSEIREARGMTQEQLALKSKVSRAQISGIESGRVAVTTTGTLQKLADAMGVKVSDIFFTD